MMREWTPHAEVDAGFQIWIKGGVKTAVDSSDKGLLIVALLERIVINLPGPLGSTAKAS